MSPARGNFLVMKLSLLLFILAIIDTGLLANALPVPTTHIDVSSSLPSARNLARRDVKSDRPSSPSLLKRATLANFKLITPSFGEQVKATSLERGVLSLYKKWSTLSDPTFWSIKFFPAKTAVKGGITAAGNGVGNGFGTLGAGAKKMGTSAKDLTVRSGTAVKDGVVRQSKMVKDGVVRQSKVVKDRVVKQGKMTKDWFVQQGNAGKQIGSNGVNVVKHSWSTSAGKTSEFLEKLAKAGKTPFVKTKEWWNKQPPPPKTEMRFTVPGLMKVSPRPVPLALPKRKRTSGPEGMQIVPYKSKVAYGRS